MNNLQTELMNMYWYKKQVKNNSANQIIAISILGILYSIYTLNSGTEFAFVVLTLIAILDRV